MERYPINQVFLGGSDTLQGSSADVEVQLQALKAYEEKLKAIRNKTYNPLKTDTPLWNSIDSEVEPLSPEQQRSLANSEEYQDVHKQLQAVVQGELLNLVKAKVESSDEGKKLLQTQLEIVKKLKTSIIETSNRELELFKKFKEYSRNNPGVTYDEFLKTL